MTAEFVIQIFGIVIVPIITMGILASSKLIDTPRGKKIALAAILSFVAVKPPTSGGGYKATPQSCLRMDVV